MTPTGPVRILQIGGGVFLRGFLDWMVDVARETNAFDGSVAIALSTDTTLADRLRAQDMAFTVLLRGRREGTLVEERRLVRSVSEAFGFEADWARAVAHATSPALQAIVSNTTERGLSDRAEPPPEPGRAPASFPARLTALLRARHDALGDGPDSALLVLPCELVEENGAVLCRLVRAHAERWHYPPAFFDWLARRVRFLSTLVDRIVPGFPKEEATALFPGETPDPLAVVAEPFHLWAIEGNDADRARLPLDAAGLRVVWTDNLVPWRDSKVRVLNGGHIAITPAGLLAGLPTVGAAMADPALRRFLETLIERDILPFLPLPDAEARAYAASVIERFDNPFLQHELAAIATGAINKWRIRLLPSLRDGIRRDGVASDRLAFTLAALLVFSRGEPDAGGAWQGRSTGATYPLRDDAEQLARIAAAWREHGDDVAALSRHLLSDPTLWGEKLAVLPGLAEAVAAQLSVIIRDGITAALARLV